MTWPLATNAGHRVLRAIYFWDAYTNAMILGSRVDALLGRGPLSLYDDYFFAPLPHSIVFNENLFGLSLIFAPFYLLSHNPLWAYNLTLLVSLGLSVFFTYLLVLRLTKSAHAGVVVGVAFAFCPFVLFEIGRIQLVATQWVPAAFLLLSRAIEDQRRRDIIGFWLCILLQIGTCLYNALFLLPLLALLGGVLSVRRRPSLRFFYWFGACALAAGGVAFLMVHPYFSARHAFNLERSLSFASSYDGKFSFFGNVSESNRTLIGMHHPESSGAHEEIAFPGFSVLALSFLSFAVPAWRWLRAGTPARALITSALWLLLALASFTIGLLGHSLLPGALVFAAGVWFLVRRGVAHPFAGVRGLYLAVLLLALLLFLGLEPLVWRGAPVRGLYYYFYTYFPGFDGIRKVSRQALMTSFVVCVLAGFGAAWLFTELRRERHRIVGAVVLLSGLCYELRCFPHDTEPVWSGAQVPAALSFVATLPANDLVASFPLDAGRVRFWGDAGLTLHNYLSLYHKHRFVNGQSSWQPPVTELARRALEHLPDENARRALLSIGTRHLILFADELPPESASLPDVLAARPNEYRRVFQQGSQSVFTLLSNDEPSFDLLDPPPLPASAVPISAASLSAHSDLRPDLAPFALDGDPDTFWSSGTYQAPGQTFEVALSEARPIVALEITVRGHVMDAPISYRLSASNADQDLGTLAEQSVLRLYRAQIFTPETFVLRLVLPHPVTADRLRITVQQPMPGLYCAINELRLYDAGSH